MEHVPGARIVLVNFIDDSQMRRPKIAILVRNFSEHVISVRSVRSSSEENHRLPIGRVESVQANGPLRHSNFEGYVLVTPVTKGKNARKE